MTRTFLLFLRVYKWAVSPMFPPVCRFDPSCSSYAIESIEKHGWLKGGLMALKRLSRCHPFGGSGYDPVV